MSWNSDGWRGSYDAWKTREPDYCGDVSDLEALDYQIDFERTMSFADPPNYDDFDIFDFWDSEAA